MNLKTAIQNAICLQSLEDLVVHYDGSVRNAEGDIVQFIYGCDGLDPTYMEGKQCSTVIATYNTIIVIAGNDCPVDFNRVLQHVRAKCPYRDEIALNGDQIRRATKAFLETGALNECSEFFRNQLR